PPSTARSAAGPAAPPPPTARAHDVAARVVPRSGDTIDHRRWPATTNRCSLTSRAAGAARDGSPPTWRGCSGAAATRGAPRGRAGGPGVRLAAARFAAELGERLRDEPAPAAVLAELYAVDLYLACACVGGDAAAQRLLEERFLAGLDDVVARVDGAPAFVDEV